MFHFTVSAQQPRLRIEPGRKWDVSEAVGLWALGLLDLGLAQL